MLDNFPKASPGGNGGNLTINLSSLREGGQTLGSSGTTTAGNAKTGRHGTT